MTNASAIQTLGLSAATSRWAGILTALFKARLSSLVLLTTAAGFYLGSRDGLDGWLLFQCLGGTGALAAGAAALNQYLERDYDARMKRTADRPLPAGLMRPQTALVLGGCLSVAGVLWLALAVNLLTSVIGALTLLIYLFIYTPLKRESAWNTLVGAIPGALPPLMGWTAAANNLDAPAWALFAILFFWQMPHFLAIAWLYREDYARAGFVMLPVIDASGQRTGRQAVAFTTGLISFSLLPAFLGMVGLAYLLGAFVLGALMLGNALLFARRLSVSQARWLFLASITYLPVLLLLLAYDKMR